MAIDIGQLGSTATSFVSKGLMGIIITVGIFVLMAVILGVGLYVRYLRQFNVKVEIKSLRGSGSIGQPVYKLIYDKGGVIYSKKDKSWHFKLLNSKVALPVPPLECYELTAKGVNVIKIYQKSNEEWFYCLPDRIDTSVIIRSGVQIPIAQAQLKVVEGAPAWWNQLRKRENKKLFDPESIMMKLLPYIVPTLTLMATIFIFYIAMDKLPALVKSIQIAGEAVSQAADRLGSVKASGTGTVTPAIILSLLK